MSEPTKAPSGLQKINLKLLIDAPASLDHDVLLSIFGRWRLEQGEEIMDLADYAHVDHGPNILLVSHRWHFGIDFGEGKPGFFFSTRKGLSGSPAERLSQALRWLLEKSKRLSSEPEFPQAVTSKCGQLEIVLNDRLIAPHTDASDAVWRPAIEETAARLHGQGGARVEREKDATRRLGYRVSAASGDRLTLEELARRIG